MGGAGVHRDETEAVGRGGEGAQGVHQGSQADLPARGLFSKVQYSAVQHSSVRPIATSVPIGDQVMSSHHVRSCHVNLPH